jgi:hypothetical protein
VAQGVLVRISRAAYYAAEPWAALSPEERHVARLVAHHAQLARAGAQTARAGRARFHYSHLSAARLHGIHLWEPDDLIHLTLPSSVARGRHREGTVVHGAVLPAQEQALVHGLPATTLERTMVDAVRMLRPGQAQIVMDHGLRLGADREHVRRLIDAAAGGRGVVRAREAMGLASDLSESPGESLLNYLIAHMPFPRPQQQIRVMTRFGLHRIDTGWPSIKRGIEFDGRTKYFDYAPTDEVVFKERQREKALMEDEWGLLRIEWGDLFRPAELEHRIGRLLASADPDAVALLWTA